MFFLFALAHCNDTFDAIINIDNYKMQCVFNNSAKINGFSGTFNIGKGNKTAITNPPPKNSIVKDKDYKITIPESITFDGKKYLLKKVDSKSFASSHFTHISFDFTDKYSLELGISCFHNSSNLKEVHFGKSLINCIPCNCFCNCSSLKSIDIGDKIVSYGDHCFSLTKIKNIKIGATTEVLGNFMFYKSEIEEIDFTLYKNRRLPKSMLEDCKKLKKVTLPNNLETIESRCFFGTEIENITFPNSLTTLYDNCFSRCSKLKKADITKTKITVIPVNAFSVTNFEEFFLPKRVKKLERDCFRRCKNLKRIDLSFVEEIGNTVFAECNGLVSVGIIRPSVMGTGVFNDCFHLDLVDMSEFKLKAIPDETFINCYRMMNIEWPSNITMFGQKSFCNTGISRIVFPDNVKGFTIGKNAFEKAKLKEVHIPSNCIEIDSFAFSKIKTLNVFSFRDSSINVLSTGLFSKSKINSLLFNDITYIIGSWAFESCSIDEVEMPCISKIECHAFKYFYTNSSFYFRRGLVEIGRNAFSSIRVKVLSLPSTVEILGNGAFENNKCIKTIDLTLTKIKEIPANAFSNCSLLRTIFLPIHIENINQDAFENTPIRNVVYLGTNDPKIVIKGKVQPVFYVQKQYKDKLFNGQDVNELLYQIKVPESPDESEELTYSSEFYTHYSKNIEDETVRAQRQRNINFIIFCLLIVSIFVAYFVYNRKDNYTIEYE